MEEVPEGEGLCVCVCVCVCVRARARVHVHVCSDYIHSKAANSENVQMVECENLSDDQ